VQFSHSFLCIIVTSTHSDCVNLPDITLKFRTVSIFGIGNISNIYIRNILYVYDLSHMSNFNGSLVIIIKQEQTTKFEVFWVVTPCRDVV